MRGYEKASRGGLATCALLWAIATASAADSVAARFNSPLLNDMAVTNVRWEAGTPEYSTVTFDLAWSGSWRAKWTESDTVTGKPMELENWDAAWVFVKFLAEGDRPKNYWRHAMLDADASRHIMPGGATNTVGLSDAASSGLGVFIYRDAVGHGTNNFKGIKLRWRHPTAPDAFDPVKAEVKVHAVAMVYVPQGPFKVGSGVKFAIGKFPDGPNRPIVGGLPAGWNDPDFPMDSIGVFTDGAWLGGEPTIPYLIDAVWSDPARDGTPARSIAPKAGHLWSSLVFDAHNRSAHSDTIGVPGVLNDDFPTGYEAFYCMKYALTQGQYADFLNSLPPDVADARVQVRDGKVSGDTTTETIKLDMGAGFNPHIMTEFSGYSIYDVNSLRKVPSASGFADAASDDPVLASRDMKLESAGPAGKPNAAACYKARVPDRICNFFNWTDGFAYAAWAGLRPITELEFEKACRGPRQPVPSEYAWGPAEPKTDTYRARKASLSTYWGISMNIHDLGRYAEVGVISLAFGRDFRGSHGDGTAPEDMPSSPPKGISRSGVIFATVPSDWPNGSVGERTEVVSQRRRINAVYHTRHEGAVWRGVRSAVTTPKPRLAVPAKARPYAQPPMADADPAVLADAVEVSNVKWEAAGADHSFVTFDLAWRNSWRAEWTEPADKNVTGNPLEVESWDAAWVFVKFRQPGADAFTHATLDGGDAGHTAPAGAELSVGLSDDSARGLGVFIYRNTAGSGPVEFKNVRLRWRHAADKADPGRAELAVHAIGMVYVPEGPFKSRSPMRPGATGKGKGDYMVTPEYPLTLINSADATQPGGYFDGLGTNGPACPSWPNGYRPFYCMKRPITQGQFVTFLNSVKGLRYNEKQYGVMPMETSRPGDSRLHYARLYGLSGYTINTNASGAYTTETPNRACHFLSFPDVLSFSSWAALRPPTLLEYEKACRGPRNFATENDAWDEGACAPVPGLLAIQAVGSQVRPDSTLSYWGIRGLSLSGCCHEWPGTIGNLQYNGSQGTGSPQTPEGWPAFTAFGEYFYMSWGVGSGFKRIGIWISPYDQDKVLGKWTIADADRTGRYGARSVRTVPPRAAKNSPLQMNALPDLGAYDIALAELSGQFRNNSDTALTVAFAAPLPDACFPGGAASRAFVAAPKAGTPFKVLTVLPRSVVATALRGGAALAVQIRMSGDKMLAEQRFWYAIPKAREIKPSIIGSLDGGEVALRLKNATDKPLALTVELTPPTGVTIPEKIRGVTLAAGAEATAAFTIPCQVFPSNGVRNLPYRVTVEKSMPADGEIAVDLKTQSRWWVSRRIEHGPSMDGGEGDMAEMNDVLFSPAGDVFSAKAPPRNWVQALSGETVPLSQAGSLPSSGSAVLAATRIVAPAAREAVSVMVVAEAGKKAKGPPLPCLVWLDGKLVHDSREQAPTQSAPKPQPRAFRINKGLGTLVVECRSKSVKEENPQDCILRFTDLKDGKPVEGLVFDMRASQ
jgi:formylglycine-generating enzyme required for sulfatase activity